MSRFYSLLSSNKSLVMGILNTTPDSFSDGGRFNTVESALTQALEMHRQGAVIIDVGGESTRPGAEEVSVSDELQRVIPVIELIRKQSDVCISIDTSKPEVMSAAVNAGADIINDVNGLRANGALEACASLNVPVCLMHMQGAPRTMQVNPHYKNVVDDIKCFFEQRIKSCVDAGIKRNNLILDPGFGFGKSLEHNLQLLKNLNEFQSFDLPLLVGLSRKSMLGAILENAPSDQRLYASVAAAVLARTNGASLFRVHDVQPTVEALKVCDVMNAV
ncbi:MAG: dihydropteroate synthase [endosymbiont of Galathealinum brachiosum]|uniref:Dihydropteroate synthase n=1 Tax=endosymbiont of Galathealinum brachiosum TaxID=2200906 RepID=A0A370D8F0_9GAMM|nr:MAG: dihydropteroate synthase [endosymbiont of Galathealinum brachiosum]